MLGSHTRDSINWIVLVQFQLNVNLLIWHTLYKSFINRVYSGTSRAIWKRIIVSIPHFVVGSQAALRHPSLSEVRSNCHLSHSSAEWMVFYTALPLCRTGSFIPPKPPPGDTLRERTYEAQLKCGPAEDWWGFHLVVIELNMVFAAGWYKLVFGLIRFVLGERRSQTTQMGFGQRWVIVVL